MMMKPLRLIIFFLLGLVISVLPQGARAEWLWSDVDSLRQRFETLINDNLPDGCHEAKGKQLFGYQNAYQAMDKQIAYEMVVGLDEVCFKKLLKRLGEL